MKLVIANWKMNPAAEAEAAALAQASDAGNVVMCPPFVFLEAVRGAVTKAKLGAQDLFWAGFTGPYTGEVSATELKNFGVSHVIIGHSERRRHLGETNETVAQKTAAAVAAGLTPIVCVGETGEQKHAGQRENVIAEQITIGLQKLKILNSKFKIFIAYEPIWAVSTSPNAQADTPEETLAVISFIKDLLLKLEYQSPVSFLYGGSVNAANADSFLRHPEIAGALVGGASLQPEEMGKIIEIAAQYE